MCVPGWGLLGGVSSLTPDVGCASSVMLFSLFSFWVACARDVVCLVLVCVVLLGGFYIGLMPLLLCF